MRILFLDFDGVLNTPRTWGRYNSPHPEEALDRKLVERVSNLVNSTDAYVVISSTWRKRWGFPQLCHLLELRGFIDSNRIIGYTPDLSIGYYSDPPARQEEILEWLRQEGDPAITTYAILDDDTAGDGRWEKVAEHFVRVDATTGVTPANIEQARSLLMNTPPDKVQTT